MRLLICGDRNWTDGEIIASILTVLRPSVLIEGECRGADILARQAAEAYGIPVLKFPARWGESGRAAGMLRNQQMLDEGKPDMIIGFHRAIDSSRGTRDMLARAAWSDRIAKGRGVFLWDGHAWWGVHASIADGLGFYPAVPCRQETY